MAQSLKIAQKKEIAEVLAGFGLDPKEQLVYLALLASGSATLTPLAQRTGLPLTTVQSILPRIVKLGLADVAKRKTRSVYEAADPVALRRILERKMEEVSAIVPMLKQITAESEVAPKIVVYHRERMTDIFNAALDAKDKTVYEIVAAKDLQDILGEKYHFTKRRMKAGIRLKSLRVERREIKKYSAAIHQRELREAKFLPAELTFHASIMFWDDTVAFFSTKDEGLAWTVRSKAVRETFQQLFGLLWSVSRKMETA